jgi:hypothetical protein
MLLSSVSYVKVTRLQKAAYVLYKNFSAKRAFLLNVFLPYASCVNYTAVSPGTYPIQTAQ